MAPSQRSHSLAPGALPDGTSLPPPPPRAPVPGRVNCPPIDSPNSPLTPIRAAWRILGKGAGRIRLHPHRRIEGGKAEKATFGGLGAGRGAGGVPRGTVCVTQKLPRERPQSHADKSTALTPLLEGFVPIQARAGPKGDPPPVFNPPQPSQPVRCGAQSPQNDPRLSQGFSLSQGQLLAGKSFPSPGKPRLRGVGEAGGAHRPQRGWSRRFPGSDPGRNCPRQELSPPAGPCPSPGWKEPAAAAILRRSGSGSARSSQSAGPAPRAPPGRVTPPNLG